MLKNSPIWKRAFRSGDVNGMIGRQAVADAGWLRQIWRMESQLLASRLAERFRLPIALIGVAAVLLAAADLFGLWVSGALVVYVAAAVAVLASAGFLCAVFDRRFHRAVSALNAGRRAEAQRRGWWSRLTGWGLPVGDRLLFAVGLALFIVTFASAVVFRDGAAAALGFAGFFLVVMAQIALMARGQPTDRFVRPFS